ncbi:MAG: hypothetical protein PWP39_1725 [Pyrococcus sp.]|uniref:radical SAM protein n=1 Tax=Pyrococcus sp. TaxID=33866 RepID=UPI00258EFB2E|nr:radical SAM protein [Pyrococcus sp.]MDK2870490.1 hypothetical protein [Pyrococcus sp.]
MTRVYHIVKFQDGSAYVLFDGCNWKCKYCVWREVTRWNLCLPEETRKKLDYMWKERKVRYLTVEEVQEILEKEKVKAAFLGGGEPTLDPELKPLIKSLTKKGIKIWLITNGEGLDDEIVEIVHGITFSIKALDEELHKKLTGVSNSKVLENFKRYAKTGKVVAETVYVPGFVECEEIMRIAEFIASINPNMTLRIDPLVQGTNLDEVDNCIEKVKNIVNAYRIKVKGEIRPPKLLYPVV